MRGFAERIPSQKAHDGSLIDWFLTLSPEQRLAELESRISFFMSLRDSDESELAGNPENPQQARG